MTGKEGSPGRPLLKRSRKSSDGYTSKALTRGVGLREAGDTYCPVDARGGYKNLLQRSPALIHYAETGGRAGWGSEQEDERGWMAETSDRSPGGEKIHAGEGAEGFLSSTPAPGEREGGKQTYELQTSVSGKFLPRRKRG